MKKPLLYLLVFAITYSVGFYLHTYILDSLQVTLPFNLQKMYFFHAGFSAFLCVNFAVFSTVESVKDQLGFIYLGTMVAKIAIFCAVFYKDIFTTVSFSKTESLSLLIPIFLFLFLEVFFISKILNNLQSAKKE